MTDQNVQPQAIAPVRFWKLALFGLYVVALAVLIITGANAVAVRAGASPSLLDDWRKQHETEKYDVGVLGNSMAYVNVDFDTLGKDLGVSIVDTSTGGSRTPYWYLALKNLIGSRLQEPPRQVLVFFRDADLTTTTNGAVGYQEADLLSIAQPDDDVLYDKTLVPVKGWIRATLQRNIPLYAIKEDLRTEIYDESRAFASLFTRRSEKDIGNHIVKFVSRRNASNTPGPTAQKNFDIAIGDSYLPLLFDEAAKYDMQLIFIRVREKKYADGKPQSKKTVRYMADLRTYIEQRDGVLIDFTNEERLQPQYYRGSKDDHMNPEGRKVFTGILTEALRPLIR